MNYIAHGMIWSCDFVGQTYVFKQNGKSILLFYFIFK
jgi:hypothetical protein